MTEPVSQATPVKLDGDDDPALTFEEYVASQASWLADRMGKMTRDQRASGTQADQMTMSLAVAWPEPSGTVWELKLTRNPVLDEDDDEYLAGLDDGEGDADD